MDVRFKSETHLLKLQQGTKKLPFSVVFPRPPLLPLAQQVDAAAALVTYVHRHHHLHRHSQHHPNCPRYCRCPTIQGKSG
jgi:hypothetical protein